MRVLSILALLIVATAAAITINTQGVATGIRCNRGRSFDFCETVPSAVWARDCSLPAPLAAPCHGAHHGSERARLPAEVPAWAQEEDDEDLDVDFKEMYEQLDANSDGKLEIEEVRGGASRSGRRVHCLYTYVGV